MYAAATNSIPAGTTRQKVRSIPVAVEGDGWIVTDEPVATEAMSVASGVDATRSYCLIGHGLKLYIHVPNEMVVINRERCCSGQQKKGELTEYSVRNWWPPIEYTCDPERFSIDLFVGEADKEVMLLTQEVRLNEPNNEYRPLGVFSPINASVQSCCSCSNVYCSAKKAAHLDLANVKLEKNKCYSVKFGKTHVGAETKFTVLLPFIIDPDVSGGREKHAVAIDFADNY